MLDHFIRPMINPPLNKIAAITTICPIHPITVTLAGLCLGIIGCFFAMGQAYSIGLIFLILNRLCDALDGPIARTQHESSDFGGYLDIVCDFIIYAGFPMSIAMGLNTPSALIAATLVLFAIVICGVSFLTYAIIAEKRGLKTEHQGKKSFFFSFGLMEGTETIIYLVFICLFPHLFTISSVIFGILCIITAILRSFMAYRDFSS